MSDYSMICGKVFKAKFDDDFDFDEIYEISEKKSKNVYSEVNCGDDWIMFYDEISPCHEVFIVPDFREFNERAHKMNKNNDKVSIDLSQGIKVIEYYYNGADAPHVNLKFEDFKKLKEKQNVKLY